MNLLCRMGRHLPGEERVWNDGWFFGSCSRCGIELLSRGRRWHRVPPGYRVVWRERPPGYPDWNSLVAPRRLLPLAKEEERRNVAG